MSNPSFGYNQKDYEFGSVTHHRTKTGYIISAVVTIILIIIWFVILSVTYKSGTFVWGWKRPVGLPHQTGATIMPSTNGFIWPDDLKNRSAALGGGPKDVPNPQQRSQAALNEANVWKSFQKPGSS